MLGVGKERGPMHKKEEKGAASRVHG